MREPGDPEALRRLLAERYPAVLAAVEEVARDPAGSPTARWVARAREVLDAYAAEQTSRRKADEARAVKEGCELAAALVAALARRG